MSVPEHLVALGEPSPELAARLLGKVRFEDRLEVTRSVAMAGDMRTWVYTLQEATDFLHMSRVEDLLRKGGKGGIGYIHPPALERWVREVFQDQELALAIGELIETGQCYAERMVGIKRLLEQRLAQCQEVV
ncbi:MAG: hypothetical protein PVF47_01335 [Anaerolineae bacterium]